MDKLYVIGNGFDLWHDLPTEYERFYDFAKETLDELEQFYSLDIKDNGAWSDFENSLGCFEWSNFYEAHNYVDVTSESFRPSEAFALEDELAMEADHHVARVRVLFQEWVQTIDVSAAKRKLIFPRSANYISFNYTSTLQSVYGINHERICHIHGRADKDKCSELVFGHGQTMQEEPELDENGDSNRTMFSDAEGAAKYPFHALKKPVSEVLNENKSIIHAYSQATEITVIGHSFNYVDLPYFAELAAQNPGAKWLICCYKEEDKALHPKRLASCGVPIGNIKTCTYSDLQDEINNACA